MGKRLTIILIVSLLFMTLIALIGGFFYGRYTKANEMSTETPQITSQTIVNAIQDQYFIVTKTVFADHEVTITINENSNWSDLLWKKVITARGVIRMDMGVDMNNLGEEDISIDHEKKIVTIFLPSAEILSTQLEGDMEYSSKDGVISQLEEIFKNDATNYNLALNTLKESAELALLEEQLILEQAQGSSISLIELIVNNLGYELEVK